VQIYLSFLGAAEKEKMQLKVFNIIHGA